MRRHSHRSMGRRTLMPSVHMHSATTGKTWSDSYPVRQRRTRVGVFILNFRCGKYAALPDVTHHLSTNCPARADTGQHRRRHRIAAFAGDFAQDNTQPHYAEDGR